VLRQAGALASFRRAAVWLTHRCAIMFLLLAGAVPLSKSNGAYQRWRKARRPRQQRQRPPRTSGCSATAHSRLHTGCIQCRGVRTACLPGSTLHGEDTEQCFQRTSGWTLQSVKCNVSARMMLRTAIRVPVPAFGKAPCVVLTSARVNRGRTDDCFDRGSAENFRQIFWPGVRFLAF